MIAQTCEQLHTSARLRGLCSVRQANHHLVQPRHVNAGHLPCCGSACCHAAHVVARDDEDARGAPWHSALHVAPTSTSHCSIGVHVWQQLAVACSKQVQVATAAASAPGGNHALHAQHHSSGCLTRHPCTFTAYIQLTEAPAPSTVRALRPPRLVHIEPGPICHSCGVQFVALCLQQVSRVAPACRRWKSPGRRSLCPLPWRASPASTASGGSRATTALPR
jgi:hypothetical protein